MFDAVAVRREGPVAVVTLSRPDALNTLGHAGWIRLANVLDDLSREPGVRVVVLTGAGERAFSAGSDIAEFPENRMSTEAALEYNGAIASALEALMSCERPVLAMVRGLAVGGGCEIAAASDVRIASADSRFGFPIGRLGVTLGHTEASALVRLIGPGRLKELVFSGRLVDAAEAREIGLVERVVPRERLVEETSELAATIASSAATTMKAVKLVAGMWGRPLTPLDAETLVSLTVEAYDGADFREGVAAFLEKRSPRFGAAAGAREDGA